MTIGNLDYYDGNIYTLTLKDANPTDTYEASLSFKLPASETLQLVSGDYPVSTGSGEMTLDAAKSSWTFIDKENFNDRIKNTIKEGSLTVTNNGNHNYTVTGTLRGASDTGQETAIKIDFTGTVPFNNYSTPPAPEAPKATMTVGDLYYNGDNVFFLGLKDGSPIKEYGITFYITLAPTDPLQLASGDYTGGAAGENMTFDLAKSFWNYNDPTYGIIKNRITEELSKSSPTAMTTIPLRAHSKPSTRTTKIPSSKSNTPENFPARITPIDLSGVAPKTKKPVRL